MYKIKIAESEFLVGLSKELDTVLFALPRDGESYIFSDDTLSELEIYMNFAIVDKGMDNQETVNETGIRLYLFMMTFCGRRSTRNRFDFRSAITTA